MIHRCLIAFGVTILGSLPSHAIEVLILSPTASRPSFGEVIVEVKVMSIEPIAEVLFRFENEDVLRLEAPPYRVTIDTGTENRDKTFEVVVTDIRGETAREQVTTRAVSVDGAVKLDLQQMYITVTQNGMRTTSVPREAFQILDQGEPQEIVTFEAGGSPVTAVLLIDASFSMRGERLRASLLGARQFIEDLRDLDLAKVVVFSDTTLIATDFSNHPSDLDGAVRDLDAAHGTAINDHMYMALKALDREEGRPVIVLLSDGVDVESVLDMENVLWRAKRTQPLFFWIRPAKALPPEKFNYYSQWRDPERHRSNILGLAELVEESGGRIFEITEFEDAPQIFQEIAAELREQYVLGYYPTADLDDETFHRVTVRAEGARTHTRSGYFDVAR